MCSSSHKLVIHANPRPPRGRFYSGGVREARYSPRARRGSSKLDVGEVDDDPPSSSSSSLLLLPMELI
jgi:hypothetical protein